MEASNNMIEGKILDFIVAHHVLTLATQGDTGPYCANMFYGWCKEYECFVFTSDTQTRHARQATENPHVAGSIVLETRIVGKVQGLQFNGMMHALEQMSDQQQLCARKAYLRRFPYAVAMELSLWIVEPTFFKLTDNTLGFGKKLIWHKDEQ